MTAQQLRDSIALGHDILNGVTSLAALERFSVNLAAEFGGLRNVVGVDAREAGQARKRKHTGTGNATESGSASHNAVEDRPQAIDAQPTRDVQGGKRSRLAACMYSKPPSRERDGPIVVDITEEEELHQTRIDSSSSAARSISGSRQRPLYIPDS